MTANSHHDDIPLLLTRTPLDHPQVSRRSLLALGSLLALELAGCGGGAEQDSNGGPGESRQNGGVVTTLAGSGAMGRTDGTGRAATFNHPRAVAVDASGVLYVADTDNQLIRKITQAGVVTTLAGSGLPGLANGTGAAATFANPTSVAVAPDGTVYVADTDNNCIRKITPAGVVTTLAGSGPRGKADGVGAEASFKSPYGVAVDANGVIYVADTNNFLIRKITPAGVVTTLAGSGQAGNANGTGAAASFDSPRGIAVDATGTVYVSDGGNGLIRKITPAGVVTTLAGSGQDGGGYADGIGTAASFAGPYGIVAGASGTVYIADQAGSMIRTVTPAGVVSTLAGLHDPNIGGGGGRVDGTGAAARFFQPAGVTVDANETVYVADTYNNQIRKIV